MDLGTLQSGITSFIRRDKVPRDKKTNRDNRRDKQIDRNKRKVNGNG